MKTIPSFIVVVLIAATSCNTKNNQQPLKALSKSLEQVNQLITENNQVMLAALEEKTKDPQTMSEAIIWAPIAFRIKEKARALFQYLEALKGQVSLLKEDDVSGAERVLETGENNIYYKVLIFSQDVIQVLGTLSFPDNPSYQAIFKKDINTFKTDIHLRFRISKDSTAHMPVTAADWTKHNLANASPALLLAMLNKLQNDVLVTENSLLEYCNLSKSISEYYENFKPLVIMNRSYAKQGQSIEVYAGVAAFRSSVVPYITIDGKPVKADEDGVATYYFNAKVKPGKYKVPVTIEFAKPDGTSSRINKDIIYTVVE